MFIQDSRTFVQFGNFIPCKLNASTKTTFKFEVLEDFCEHASPCSVPSDLDLILDPNAQGHGRVIIAKGSFIYTGIVDNIPQVEGISCVFVHHILLVELPKHGGQNANAIFPPSDELQVQH